MWCLFAAAAWSVDVPARVMAIDEGLAMDPGWIAESRPILDDLVPGEVVTALEVRTYFDSLDPRTLTTVVDERGHQHEVATYRLAFQVLEDDAHRVWLGELPRRVEGVTRWWGALWLTDAEGTVLDQVWTPTASLMRVVQPPDHAVAGAGLLFGVQATRRSCPGGFSGLLFAVAEGRLHRLASYGGYGEVGEQDGAVDSEHTWLAIPALRDGRLVWTDLAGEVVQRSVLAARDRVHLLHREEDVWVEQGKTFTQSAVLSERSWTEMVRYESTLSSP